MEQFLSQILDLAVFPLFHHIILFSAWYYADMFSFPSATWSYWFEHTYCGLVIANGTRYAATCLQHE